MIALIKKGEIKWEPDQNKFQRLVCCEMSSEAYALAERFRGNILFAQQMESQYIYWVAKYMNLLGSNDDSINQAG